jgi:hypothetical protein
MALPSVLTLGTLGLGIVGALTATDLVSLREVAHAVDVPVLSATIIALRESMPSSTAHALEPLAAVVGLGTVLVPGSRTMLARMSRATRVPAPSTIAP